MTTDKLSAQIKLTEYDLWGGKSLDGDEDDGACERCLKFNLTGVCRCREWERKKVYRRVSDNNNLLLINDLNHLHGMDFRATDKDELPAMVNDLRLLVKQGRFLIHPRCIMLIACCKYGIYNSAKIQREFARSKVYGHYDWLASAVYLVRNLDEKTNPISLTHGLHYTTHHIPADLEKAEKEKGWAQVAPQKFVSRTRN